MYFFSTELGLVFFCYRNRRLRHVVVVLEEDVRTTPTRMTLMTHMIPMTPMIHTPPVTMAAAEGVAAVVAKMAISALFPRF